MTRGERLTKLSESPDPLVVAIQRLAAELIDVASPLKARDAGRVAQYEDLIEQAAEVGVALAVEAATAAEPA